MTEVRVVKSADIVFANLIFLIFGNAVVVPSNHQTDLILPFLSL